MSPDRIQPVRRKKVTRNESPGPPMLVNSRAGCLAWWQIISQNLQQVSMGQHTYSTMLESALRTK